MDEIAFGRGFRALRIRRRVTQAELGARAGVSRGVIARIEQGHGSRVSLATLERVSAVLGARVLVKLLWQGDGLDRLLDARHATTVEAVVRSVRISGWDVATEVSFSVYGERGSIDLLAFHAPTQSLLVVEVKTTIADAQELQATMDRKLRLAPQIGRDRGWVSSTASKLLVVTESRANRQRVEGLAATFANAFPARTWSVRRWIARPVAGSPLHGLWFVRTGPQAVVTQRVRHRRSDPEGGGVTRD